MASEAVREVARVICGVYGDACVTALDTQAADAVVRHLSEAGWVPPEVVAALVESAGGAVEVVERSVVDPPRLFRVDGVGTWRFETRRP